MDFDVAIIGAGPAGSSCALALAGSGLRVVLIDQATFPRDKVCGDAIPGTTLKWAKLISAELAEQLRAWPKEQRVFAMRFAVPNGRRIKHQWVLESYNVTRMEFDHRLFGLAAAADGVTTHLGKAVAAVSARQTGFALQFKDGSTLTAKMAALATGSASHLPGRLHVGYAPDPQQHITALRTYWEGIDGLQPGTNEVYCSRAFPKGYFWIFPLGGGMANVGLGFQSAWIRKRKINLKSAFEQIIAEEHGLRERFAGARLVGRHRAFALLTGGPALPAMSGEGWLLLGDAACLIDPLTGHGIDHALLSGYLAAQQIRQSFEHQDFSSAFLQQYDRAVRQKLGRTLVNNYRAVAQLNHPSLINLGSWLWQWYHGMRRDGQTPTKKARQS